MAYQTTGLASAGLGVTRQQFVNGQPVSYYVDPNPATLVVPQIVPRPIALPPLVSGNNWGHDDPHSLSFNGPPAEVGAWANAYALAQAQSGPFVIPGSQPAGDYAGAIGLPQAPAGGAAPFAPPNSGARAQAQTAAIQVVTNPPQVGLVQPQLPPTQPTVPAPPPMPGQPNITPPAPLPDDQPGTEVETFHDAQEDADDEEEEDEEGIGGGDGEPAVVPGALPDDQVVPGAGPPAPPPPPMGWHPGMRTVDAQHTPAMAPVAVVDVIAAQVESAAQNPTMSGAPSGSPGPAAGVAPAIGAGATAATNAMMAAVLEIGTDQEVPAISPATSMDLSPIVQAGLGIPLPPPPPPMVGAPPAGGGKKKGKKNKGKGKAHPVPNQFAEQQAAENAAFSGSAAMGRTDAQSELLAAVRSGGGLKPAGSRRNSGKPYERPQTKEDKEIAARQEMMAAIKQGGNLRKTAGPRVMEPEAVETATGWKRLGGAKKANPVTGDQPTGMDEVARAMQAALAKRNAAIHSDNEDEQGDQMMDDVSESGWDEGPGEIEMDQGMGASVDPNLRADQVNIAAAAALAGRSRRGVGSPFGSTPDFSAAGKFDQQVPMDDEPGWAVQDLPAGPSDDGLMVQNMPSPPAVKKAPPKPPKGKKPKPGKKPT